MERKTYKIASVAAKATFNESKTQDSAGKEIEVGTIEAYVATWEKDRVNDIITRKAFDNTIEKDFADIRFTLNHNEVIGVVKSLTPDSYGLKMIAEIPLENQTPREAYNLAKLFNQNGQTLQYSFVAKILDKEVTKEARILKELKLEDVSLLTVIGANAKTKTVAIKDMGEEMDGEQSDDMEMEETGTCPVCGSMIDFTNGTEIADHLTEIIGQQAINALRYVTYQEVNRAVETKRPEVRNKVQSFVNAITIKAAGKTVVCKNCGSAVQQKRKMVQKALNDLINHIEKTEKLIINLNYYK